MTTRSLQRRSSWPSSLLTGLIGWNSFMVIVALSLRYSGPPWPLFGLAVFCGLIETVFLRLAFFVLRMDRSVWIGAFWGTLTGAALAWLTRSWIAVWENHFLVWMITGAYVGAAVGAFLSYFFRDDREIEQTAAGEVSYGRDAHWLEPFAFGAVAYGVVFLPSSLDLAVYVLVIGAMSGVFSAGASHFSPDEWKQSVWLIALLSIVAGGVQGVLSGFLFSQFVLWRSSFLLGAISGIVLYTMTLWRGRHLAARERAAAH